LLFRLVSIAALAAAAPLVFSQGDGGGELLLSRPDVMIRVEKAPVGADYVTIQMVSDGYPADLLVRQCEQIGKLAGGSSRGIEVQVIPGGASPGGVPLKIVTATFAADGLIDAESGVLRLVPFAKAFAGVPEPFTIDCIALAFKGVAPRRDVSVSKLSNESVDLVGGYDPEQRLVDYRITLKTQDAAKITFPETLKDQTNASQNPSSKGVPSRLLWWIAGGAVAAGVLVYFALRPYGRRPSTKPDTR
jgi:hypothetical protein